MELMTHYNPNPGPSEWLLRRREGQRFNGHSTDVSGTIKRALYYRGHPFFLLERHPSQPMVWVHATRDRA